MNMTVRIQLSVMMFLQFFVWGAWFVPMWPYLNASGFEAHLIGYAYSTTGWAAIISPFLVGMVVDRFFAAERALGLLHLAGGVLLYLASTIQDPYLFIAVLLGHTICYMPTLALVNSLSFDHMDDPSKEFPSVRVLGTIGWIVAGLIIGFMPEGVFQRASIEDTSIPMKIGAACSILLGFYCFTLPHTPPKAQGKKVTIKEVLGLDALRMLKEPSFAIFVLGSLLVCIPLAFYYQSANGFLNEIGVKNAAGKMTMGQMSEIFFMLVMPFFLLRLGVKKMLLIGMLAWTVRYVLFAFGDTGPLVWMLYVGILLHGICYDFFFVTGQIYIDQKAPREIRASAQGFITLVTLGLGMVIGNMINGYITGHFAFEGTTVDSATGESVVATLHHWKPIWLIPAAMAAIVMVVFAALFHDNGAKNAAAAADTET